MSNQDFYDAIFPAGFWDTLDRSNFQQDERSMFADAPVFDWLIRTISPADIIEVGSWKGHSANFMIDVCRSLGIPTRLVAVDTFLGGPEHWLLPGMIEQLARKNGQPTILEAFFGNTVARGNEGSIFPLCLDSSSASEVLNHFGFRSDLIFIDGGHDYDSVKKDITLYHKILSEGGVMFGDDYQHEPLANAVHDCAKELGVHVLVTSRKWIFFNEALIRRLSLTDIQLRTSYDGWVHP